jgi:hypothetical protein
MNIWTGLLFLEGAVGDVSLARELSREEISSRLPLGAAAPTRDTPAHPATSPSPRTQESVL